MFLFLSKASLQLYSDFSRKQTDKSHQITLKSLKNFFEKFLIFLLTNLFFSGIILNVPLMRIQNARVAQLVERDLAKVEAAGSSPVSRFSYGAVALANIFCWAAALLYAQMGAKSVVISPSSLINAVHSQTSLSACMISNCFVFNH